MIEERRIKVVVGHGKSVEEAISRILASNLKPVFSVLFADARMDQERIARIVQERLGGTVWGMSSAGEISSEVPGIKTGSVAIMAFQAPQQTISIGTGSAKVKPEPFAAEKAGEEATRQAFSNLKFKPEYLYLGMLRKPAIEMVAATPYTLLVGHDGRTFIEEDTIRGIANVVGRGTRVVGGSAADALSRFTEPRTYLNGRAMIDELSIAVVGTTLKNGTGMANAFEPALGKGLFITSSAGRIVKTFNGRPAADAYTELVGAKSKQEAEAVFKHHPLGLLDATSGYWQVRSPAKILEEGAMSFFSAVPPGIGLTMLRATPASRIQSVKTAVLRAWHDAGRPKRVAAVVLFNCILCHLQAEEFNCATAEINAVNEALQVATGHPAKIPMIGFSTFGETGATITGTLGHHNQTLTAWLIGDELVHEAKATTRSP
jgi:hypothetical protein